MKFLNAEQIAKLLQTLDRAFGGVNSLPDLCAQLSSGSNPGLTELLLDLLVRAFGETVAA